MQRKPAGALLVVLAVGMTACGSASKPLTAPALRAQAGAICRQMTRRVDALGARAKPATMHAAMRSAAGVMSDGVARLEALTPPPRLADRYARLLEWKRAQRDAAGVLARPGGRLSVKQREAVRGHRNPASTLSLQLGIDGC